MLEPNNEKAVMRNYLLGALEEPLREEVEERIVCDSGFAERLVIEQDNLIDDYIFDGLSEAERENFEKNFVLNPERRHKLKIAQAFEMYVAKDLRTRHAADRFSWLNFERWRTAVRLLQRHKVWATTLAVATVLLLVFLAPKLVNWLLPNTGPSWAEQRARIERELSDLNRDPSRWVNSATVELALQPTTLRAGGETKKVVLTNDIRLIKLELESPPVKYDRYRTVIETVEGRELFAVEELKSEREAHGGVILLRIPSEFLSTGDYQIELQGMTGEGRPATVAYYNFRIIKNNTTP